MRLKEPIFSVCIPTFNRLGDLKNCIASVISAAICFQGNVEIVVSDNASTDGTSLWLQNLELNYPNIIFKQYKNIENIGAIRNIKKIAKEATGSYIMLLTDDDLLVPSALNILHNCIVDKKTMPPHFVKVANLTFMTKSKRAFFYGLKNTIDDFSNPINFFDIEKFSHILSGCVVKNHIGLIERINDSQNVYPSIELCALSAGRCIFLTDPLVIHYWENEIYWDLDVDMTSSLAKQQHLDRDAQLALLNLPDNFFDTKGITLLYKNMLNRYGYIERAIELKFPISKLLFLKIKFVAIIKRGFLKLILKIFSVLRVVIN
jgi:glycosyltransferase involved in cell wall biosynthesis